MERFKAIQAFVPEAFYKIKGMLEENEHGTILKGLMALRRKKVPGNQQTIAAEVISSSFATIIMQNYKGLPVALPYCLCLLPTFLPYHWSGFQNSDTRTRRWQCGLQLEEEPAL